MNTLALIQYHRDDNQKLMVSAANNSTLQACKEIGQPIDAIVIGHDILDITTDIARYDGINRVFCLNSLSYQQNLPEFIAPVVSQLMADSDYNHFVTSATTEGKNVTPRIAALLDVMQISEITKIVSPDTFEHFIYAGSAVKVVQSQQDKHVLTIRVASFDDSSPKQTHPAKIIMLSASDFPTVNHSLSQLISKSQQSHNATADLSTADIVVAGGGGISSQETFDTSLKPLAKRLKAAIGASRMLVDNGFCGSDALVGQTGKAIAPELYIAVGVSGANQHIAGMKESKVIVAINNDEMAPIFHYADYGFVGDVDQILPELTKKLDDKLSKH